MTAGWLNALRTPDHYYWLTAYLAAHDLQRAICRAVAGSILALGLMPLLLMASPVGPQGTRNQILAVIVALCCAAMSVPWLRHSWPSKTVSIACVVLGTACIATACLIATRPGIGVLGAMSFAMVAAFTALFHSRGLLLVPWTVGAVTLGIVAYRLASIDIALAVCSALLIALIIVFVSLAGDVAIRLTDARNPRHADIEPLTGLLNHDAFHERVAGLIGARNRTDDRYLVVMVINVDSFSLLTAVKGQAGGKRSRIAISQRLREAIRRDTVVAHVSEAEFLVGDLFTSADASPLADRLHGAVRAAPGRLTPSIGVVSTPLDPLVGHPAPDVLEELLAIATEAMQEARRAGGNQTRLVVSPELAVLNRGHPDEWRDDLAS